MKKSLISFFMLYIFLFCAAMYPQWQQQANGLPQLWNQGNAIDACNNDTAIIAVDQTLFETTDAGNSWTKTSYSFFDAVDVSIKDKNHFWVCTGNGQIIATSDGGTIWSIQYYDTTKTKFIDYIKMFDLNNGIAIGDAKGNNPALILSTTDDGADWISINDTAFKSGFSGDVWARISFINKNTGYFYVSGITIPQLFKTTDGGKSWIQTNYPNQWGDLIKFYNENLGFVVSMLQPLPDLKEGIFRTKDGGNSWETFDLSSTSYPTDIEFVPGNPSKVWFVNLESLYYSSDTGRTWSEQKIYNGQLGGRDLIFTDSIHGWLLCDNGKVFHTSNNGGIISAISSDREQTPSCFLLMQNYPNPFNLTTIINYQIPPKGFLGTNNNYVTLKVYDILGRLVKTLVDGYKTQGSYSVCFNASNFASGIYFYQLKAGSFQQTKKLILLK